LTAHASTGVLLRKQFPATETSSLPNAEMLVVLQVTARTLVPADCASMELANTDALLMRLPPPSRQLSVAMLAAPLLIAPTLVPADFASRVLASTDALPTSRRSLSSSQVLPSVVTPAMTPLTAPTLAHADSALRAPANTDAEIISSKIAYQRIPSSNSNKQDYLFTKFYHYTF
jgi:hypothetical protein